MKDACFYLRVIVVEPTEFVASQTNPGNLGKEQYETNQVHFGFFRGIELFVSLGQNAHILGRNVKHRDE